MFEWIAVLLLLPAIILITVVGENAIAQAINDAGLPFLITIILTAAFPGSLILYLLGQ